MTVPRVLGVIPARGGSKRLPRKNVRELCGFPLIAWTIQAARLATHLTDWLVTSEDAEILAVARRYGAPTPFVRPTLLAGDEVRNIDTVAHALEYMTHSTGEPYDIVMLLQPTCPIRDPKHIDMAVALLTGSDMDTLASVKGPYQKRDPIAKRIEDGALVAYCTDPEIDAREPLYLYNASIYAARCEYFLRERRLISERQVPLVLDVFHSTDIDNEADLLVAEAYLRHLGDRGFNPEEEV